MEKIRIAFVKFGGLSAGGTEKFLHNIALNLNPQKFDVTFFYSDGAPYLGSSIRHPETDPFRLELMEQSKIKLRKFEVKAKDLNSPTHKWVDTNFFKIFNENDFDIVQTGRAGHPEYPFTKIKRTAIVDSIHLDAGVHNQGNITHVLHLSTWSRDRWVARGGDPTKARLVSHPIDQEVKTDENFRSELGLDGKVIFGFHQRPTNEIFSYIPLEAFSEMNQSDSNHFILMGGGSDYRDQAKVLGISNITFLNFSGDPWLVQKFLNTLDIYAHGRKDGELNSTAIAEALRNGLPVVSHSSQQHMGHIECIGEGGRVVDTVLEYRLELNQLISNPKYYSMRSAESKKQFLHLYELVGQMKRIEEVYEESFLLSRSSIFVDSARKYNCTWKIRRQKILYSLHFYLKRTLQSIFSRYH